MLKTNWIAACVCLSAGTPCLAQNRDSPPLIQLPTVVFSADYEIRVEQLAGGLANPWSLRFLPDGDMLVTTRAGQIRRLSGGLLNPTPVAGGPEAHFAGTSGLPGAVHGYMDLVLHPDFENNELLYLSYTKPVGGERNALGIGRGRWTGAAIADFEDIYVGEPGSGRSAFAGRCRGCRHQAINSPA